MPVLGGARPSPERAPHVFARAPRPRFARARARPRRRPRPYVPAPGPPVPWAPRLARAPRPPAPRARPRPSAPAPVRARARPPFAPRDPAARLSRDLHPRCESARCRSAQPRFAPQVRVGALPFGSAAICTRGASRTCRTRSWARKPWFVQSLHQWVYLRACDPSMGADLVPCAPQAQTICRRCMACNSRGRRGGGAAGRRGGGAAGRRGGEVRGVGAAGRRGGGARGTGRWGGGVRGAGGGAARCAVRVARRGGEVRGASCEARGDRYETRHAVRGASCEARGARSEARCAVRGTGCEVRGGEAGTLGVGPGAEPRAHGVVPQWGH